MRLLTALFCFACILSAQSPGVITGVVILKDTGEPLHRADVQVNGIGRRAVTADDGTYRIEGLPPGRYQVVAHLDSLFTEEAKTVEVAAGEESRVDFALAIRSQRFQVAVTASAKEETPFESFSSVKTLDAYDLAINAGVSLGETLSNQVGSGVAKRSFGPGSSRPIIRGFDGDRVLVMQDGVRTGTLSSQSGDHGEVINTSQLERLEIVKGPATLLYSGSAMGGTVNAITRHHTLHFHPHTGLRGYFSGTGGSANRLGGANAGFEYGHGNWMIWGQGGGVRSGDYATPLGEIYNSRSRLANGGVGLGWYGERMFASFDVNLYDSSTGVPFAQLLEAHGEEHEGEEEEELNRVSLDARRENYRVNWGIALGKGLDNFLLKLDYTQWQHDEIEYFSDGASELGTRFNNNQFVYRGEFEQRPRGALSGRFGFWGLRRDYKASGSEALAPPVDQNGFAVFALEELGFERVKVQFGGRVETNRYVPAVPGYGNRSLTGASAAAGIHVNLWSGGAFVANYAHSYRPPAIEELYNLGPHAGNVAFEIGDPSLNAERGNGFDLSLRHDLRGMQAEANFFYYRFRDFIFPFATGEVEDGLNVIQYTQRPARYIGGEASLSVPVHDYWRLNMGMDIVNAKETALDTPLPRIPPLRGKVGVDFNWRGLQVSPQLILASDQSDTFTTETRTPGYAVVNLTAAYTYALQHVAHQFSFNVFNLGDRLYRNHSSFIKDLAPEMGRGVQFTYLVRFF